MKSMHCAVCGTKTETTVVYEANYPKSAVNERTFSARRVPDRYHYRMVRCAACGLLFSDPILSEAELHKLYRKSELTYDTEINDLTDTYAQYLDRMPVGKSPSILEIGCGNGFFLERARTMGFAKVAGVEPSPNAVAKAPKPVRKAIKTAFFKPGLFPVHSFDVVSCFQTLDHVPDPNMLVAESFRITKPGGYAYFITHNTKAPSARIMGERSPIIDIEHIYLFDPGTITRLFAKHGYTDIRVIDVRSVWSVSYLNRMMPLPGFLKTGLGSFLGSTGLGSFKIGLKPGNLALFARKPLTAKRKTR